ncbi:MAG: hypothetical protein OEZ36_12000, partial [Spirochaetota bacterium]|nr:hypothetical protein [Spirochaetota bacterium]
IADLLHMDFFDLYFSSKKQFNVKEIQELKNGKANRALLIEAQKQIFSIVKKTLDVVEKTLNFSTLEKAKNNKKLIDQMNSIIKFFENSCFAYDILASYIKLSEFEELYLGTAEPLNINLENGNSIYKSYFSKKALEHIQEHIHFERPPDIKRRYLTVLFLDIVGFSTMSEHADPAIIMEMLNLFFNEVNNSVRVHEGDIDKFIGDAMLATFDSAEEAVRCSMNILFHDLEVVNSKLEHLKVPELKVHIGINTDWVVQGDVGSDFRRETTVIGDGVNIAARVEGLSPPNEMWLTANTVASLGKLRWEMESVGKHKLKGRAQEVTLYRHVNKLRGIIEVLLYEPDKSLSSEVIAKLNATGIKNIICTHSHEELRNKVTNPAVGIVLLGPTLDTNKVVEITNYIEKIRKPNIPVIPILKKDLDAKNYGIFDKLGLKINASVNKESSLKKVNRVIANEEVKYIPKLKEQPPPEKVKDIVSKGISEIPTEDEIKEVEAASEPISGVEVKVPAPTIAENKEPAKPEIIETKPEPPSKEEIKKEVQRKTNISVIGNDLRIIAKDVISPEGFAQIKEDITHLYQYSLQKKINQYIINLEAIDELKISEDMVKDFINIMQLDSSLKKVKIKLEFPGGQTMPRWEEFKSQFPYEFTS